MKKKHTYKKRFNKKKHTYKKNIHTKNTYKKKYNKKKLGGNVKQCDDTIIKCNDYVLNAHGFYIQELEFITIPEDINIITYGPFNQASCFLNNINNFLCINNYIPDKTRPVPNVYKTFPANSIIPNLIFHSDLKKYKKSNDQYIVENQFFKSYLSKCDGDIILNIDNMMDNIFDRCINIQQNTQEFDCLNFIDNDFKLNINMTWMDKLFQYYKSDLINYKNITNLPDLFFNGYISLYTIFKIINKYKLFINSNNPINIHLLTCLSVEPLCLLNKIYLKKKITLNIRNNTKISVENQNREFYFNINNHKLLLIYPTKDVETEDKKYTDKIYFINDYFTRLINGNEKFIANNYTKYVNYIINNCSIFMKNFIITKDNNFTTFEIKKDINTFYIDNKNMTNMTNIKIENFLNNIEFITINDLGTLLYDNINKFTNLSKIIYYFLNNDCLDKIVDMN